MSNILPEPNEPLVLADGTRVYASGRLESPTPVPLAPRAKKHIKDIPTTVPVMNAVSVVLGYTLYGLDDTGICEATRLNEQQLKQIRDSETFATMLKEATDSILFHDAQNVRSVIASKSRKAAEKLAAFVDCDNPALSFAASREVLDRSGHRPIDVHEHHIRTESELRIIHVRQDSNAAKFDLVESK